MSFTRQVTNVVLRKKAVCVGISCDNMTHSRTLSFDFQVSMLKQLSIRTLVLQFGTSAVKTKLDHYGDIISKIHKVLF